MGQNDSKQIEENLALLELENAIQHAQAQKFLHDYHTNDPAVDDVKKFDANKLKMFLKYFIMQKYPGRTIEKQSTKRAKTNQSVATNEERTFDNLAAMLCFQIYKIDENLAQVYKLISKFILTSTHHTFNEACKGVLKILGVKECCMTVLNKHNFQEMKLSYSQEKEILTIKEKGLQRSPYPRSQKYRFRKMQKAELIKEKIIMDQTELSSEVFYVEETPTKQRSSALILSFQDHKVIETFGEKADSKNIVEKYTSSIGQFLIRMATLNHFEETSSDEWRKSQPKSTSLDLMEEDQNHLAEICWNLLKIYKINYDFEHSLLIEKIKKEYKALFKPNTTDASFRQLKAQLVEKFNSEPDQSQANEEIKDFLNQYERKHLATRNELSDYLQKYFQSISKDTLEFEFDSNTELKVLVCSRQTVENHSILNTIRQIVQKGNTPTLLDIFRDLKAFRQFYTKSYQDALKQQDEQKIFEHQGVILQFKFIEQAIHSIKISVSLESLAEKYRKSVASSPKNSRRSTLKKKFSEFHNEEDNSDNKENCFHLKTIEDKSTEVIRISIKTSSNKNLNILDLTAEVDHVGTTDFDIYDTSLNILEIHKPHQFKLAYDIAQQMTFYKLRHPQFSQKLINFLEQLKEGYQQNNNPFHNFTHGVNVMHTAFLLTNISNMSQFLSDFTKFTLVISALCHDVGHTGFNNAFEIAKGSYLAELFNDMSPLQNYHISRTLAILKNEECDFLHFMSKEEKNKFRKLLISNILNTDMKEHFNVLKKFEEKKNNFKKDDLEDEKVLCGMLIHSSDFGASTKQFAICQQWSKLVNQQFMNQSKKEAELGLPLSPFMLNLDNEFVMAKNELGFLKFMVQPLFKSISQSFSEDQISGIMFKNVNKNIESWDNKIKVFTG